MTFIDDNGNQLEFGGEFAMTKQAVSFFNGSIKGDVSINFTVDNNSVNRKVLGYYGPQMTSQVAWTKQAFNRVRNGNILDRGYIVIQNEDGDKLSCFYVSGNSNWVQLLTGIISNLNLTSYGVTYNYTNIQSSFASTSGIIFPFVDWNYNLKKGDKRYYPSDFVLDSRNNAEFSLNDFYPCFYVSSLVNEIFNQNGLKISGTLLSDHIFKSLIITPSNGEMKREVFKNVNLVGSSSLVVGAGTTVKYNLFTEIQDPDGIFSNGTYTANKAALLSITLTVTSTAGGNIFIYKNGVSLVSMGVAPAGLASLTYNVTTAINDTFEIYIFSGGGTTITIDTASFSIPTTVRYYDIVNPSHFLPELTSIQIIKYLINFFGCATYFNEFSKTVTCNIIEKIKTETALDWSEYYISHRSEYTVNQAQKNYIRLPDNSDSLINKYNSLHNIGFGEGSIETSNTLKKELDILEIPFKASYSGVSKNGTYTPNIPLVNLIDNGDPIAFTSVALSGGLCELTIPSTIFAANEILRISNNGVDLGYFTTFQASTGTTVIINRVFDNTFTGNIWKQTINYQNVGARILSVKPSTVIADYSSLSNWILYQAADYPAAGWGGTSTETNTAFATFTKTVIGDTIDQWKNNLAIDNPDSGGFTDPTIKQLYFNKISKFLQNPNIRAKMLLPESVYQSFVFDQFIYLRTENLTGYFFVDSIVNYIDGNTPVEVNLFML